jgi:HSP20 family protein
MPRKDLIPWNRGRHLDVRRNDDTNPFLTLHREMNRLFDDVDFGPAGFGERQLGRSFGWPNIELSEAPNEVKVTAETSWSRREGRRYPSRLWRSHH